jgi:hypothetical protein
MTVKDLIEKVSKAQEKVDKCRKTIERHKAQAEKKRNIIISKGWNPDYDRYCRQGNTPEEQDELYWLIIEHEQKLEDIESATKKLLEAEKILSNWIEKLNKQKLTESKIENEMPEIFFQCREFLAKEWTESDMKTKEIMKSFKQTLTYEEFRKRYSWSKEDSLNKTEEEFFKANFKEAELWIMNLYNDVKEITGNVTDWKGVQFHGKALEGLIVGENGVARVDCIEAGGWNIQRFHYRKLVRKVG